MHYDQTAAGQPLVTNTSIIQRKASRTSVQNRNTALVDVQVSPLKDCLYKTTTVPQEYQLQKRSLSHESSLLGWQLPRKGTPCPTQRAPKERVGAHYSAEGWVWHWVSHIRIYQCLVLPGLTTPFQLPSSNRAPISLKRFLCSFVSKKTTNKRCHKAQLYACWSTMAVDQHNEYDWPFR